MNKKLILIVLVMVLSVTFTLFAIDSRLKVVNYTLESDEISSPVRIAFISDLHSCKYGGSSQSDLIEAVRAQNPDIVLFGGDAFDCDLDPEATFVAMREIAAEYPCYYAIGNHEAGREDKDELLKEVCEIGVMLLEEENVILDINGEKVILTGVKDSGAYSTEDEEKQEILTERAVARIKELKTEAEEGFNILLFHRPENFEDYAEMDFDLVLSGHAHGGQWRIPGVLNGLYAPHQGIFPKYAGGEYALDGCTMIVSRGLAKECNWVPRVFNRPELVVIDIV